MQGLDKSEGSFFTPTYIYWRNELETVYVESWAARKYIDIPVDDMMIRWREWEAGDSANEDAAGAMGEAEKDLELATHLADAMKAGPPIRHRPPCDYDEGGIDDKPLAPGAGTQGRFIALPRL